MLHSCVLQVIKTAFDAQPKQLEQQQEALTPWVCPSSSYLYLCEVFFRPIELRCLVDCHGRCIGRSGSNHRSVTPSFLSSEMDLICLLTFSSPELLIARKIRSLLSLSELV